MALYVYGIMRSRDAAAAAGGRKGNGPTLGAVEHQGVSAIVSEIGEGELRLRRESVLGHTDALAAAFQHGPLLPLRFGTVLADDDGVVRDLLAPSADRLAARLDALENKVEMQVKATYMEEPLLRTVLAQNPSLAKAAERIQQLPPEATHFERIRLGEEIAAAVTARRAADEEAFLAALSPLVVAVAVSPPHHERSALNAGFLVDRPSLSEFDAAVEQLSEQRGGDTEFKLIGPLPPYSFADREWEAVDPRQGRAAWA